VSDEIVSQSLASISTFMAAAGALGTGSFGLIDASKAICGGMSNPGFGFVRDEVQEIIGKEGGTGGGLSNAKIMATLRANWLNGVAKADQKAAAKSLIRMCITDDRIPQLARATGIKDDALREECLSPGRRDTARITQARCSPESAATILNQFA